LILRIRFVQRGGHIHCRLFMGSREGSLGLCGELVFREEEFEVYRQVVTAGRGLALVQFIEEGH
jgi:hypothetical protein